MPRVKFTEPLQFPADPSPTAESAATLGQVEDTISDMTEPAVDLVVLFENSLL